MRRAMLPVLLTLFFVSPSAADTNIPPGSVSGWWTLSGSPYLINGDISIPLGEELTIEPGCVILFTDHHELRVFGRLLAIGTEDENINFDAVNPSVGWHGLRFINTTTNGQDASSLECCVFRHGRATGSLAEEKDGGAVYCTGSSDVLIRHCTFLENYAADEGGALYLGAGSGVRVEETRFIDNEAYFSGGAIHCQASSPVIVNTLLEANQSSVFAGGIAAWDAAHFRLENVKILYCTAMAVGGFYSVASNPVMVSCLVARNTSTYGAGGGGGLTSASNARFINTTIADNTSGQGGGGVWLYASSTAEIVSGIIWNNQPDAIASLNGSTVNVSYTDIAGGWAGDGNLNLPPVFLGTEPDPYTLGELSPCIDGGKPDTTGLGLPELDLAGHPRIANERIDMGGYEYVSPGEVSPFDTWTTRPAASWFTPNPSSGGTAITYSLPFATAVTLRVFDIGGRQVRILLDRVEQDARQHRVSWDGRGETGELVSSGTYVFLLTAGTDRVLGTVTLLR